MSIKINIGALSDGSQQIELAADYKELNLEKDFLRSNINISLDLFKSVHQLDVKVKVSGTLNFDCDRCLENFDKPFESAFEIVYVQKAMREHEIDEEFIRSYNPSMQTVDLTNDIRETVILSVPMRKVPEEKSDGSCSWCGKTKDYWNSIMVEKDELNF